MSKRVYRHDHTAYIRHRLKTQAVRAVVGLIVALLALGVFSWLFANLNSAKDPIPHPLEALAWILTAVMAGISLLLLLITGIRWINYRRMKPELDAAGAEVMGELHARLANERRNDP